MTTIPMIEVDGKPRVWITTSEAATLTRTDRSTVIRWCENGDLHGARLVGGRWRIPAAAFLTEVAP